jgi:hypothetical protein
LDSASSFFASLELMTGIVAHTSKCYSAEWELILGNKLVTIASYNADHQNTHEAYVAHILTGTGSQNRA